jgi:hypothetical protein
MWPQEDRNRQLEKDFEATIESAQASLFIASVKRGQVDHFAVT